MGTNKFAGLGHLLGGGVPRTDTVWPHIVSLWWRRLGSGVEGETCSGYLLSEVIPVNLPY